jgi:hypothetical protein
MPKANTKYQVSSHIAPVMVALDTKFNGYRTVILPLAHDNVDVRRAVCIVSALHLGSKMPELRNKARQDRISMILRLRHMVDESKWGEILSPPHWAVIILFLVGEMISGGDDFSYLLKMLLCLVQANGPHNRESDVESFLLQQTRMSVLLLLLSTATKIMANPDAGSNFSDVHS